MHYKTEVQQPVSPMPKLKRGLFSSRITCKEGGWSFWYSASGGSRIDGYHYEEDGRVIILSGEGGPTQMDIFLPDHLAWEDDLLHPLDAAEEQRIFRNITAAIQWRGWKVGFVVPADHEPTTGHNSQ